MSESLPAIARALAAANASMDAPVPRGATRPAASRRSAASPLRGVVLSYLQRTALPPGSRGALDLVHSAYAVQAAQREAQGALLHFRDQASRAPVALAAGLVVAAHRPGSAVSPRLATLLQASDPQTQQAIAATLQQPMGPAQKASFLTHLLPKQVVLAVLEAHLTQLQAINKILQDWGKHLRKLAKLDKAAHERAQKQARSFAEHNAKDLERAQNLAHRALQSLQLRFNDLGISLRHQHLQVVEAKQAAFVGRSHDRLVLARVDADDVLQSWPNLSLLAALTVPEVVGVRTQGTPRGTPGRRLYGQPV